MGDLPPVIAWHAFPALPSFPGDSLGILIPLLTIHDRHVRAMERSGLVLTFWNLPLGDIQCHAHELAVVRTMSILHHDYVSRTSLTESGEPASA